MFSHVLSALVLQWMLCSKNSCIGQTVDDICKRTFIGEYYRCALATLELLIVKHGVLDVSGCHFSSCEIDAVLDFVYTVLPFFCTSCTILY